MTLISAFRRTDEAPLVASGSLRVRDLRVGFGGKDVVRGVSFDLSPGATLVLLGESGSGKSVTARSLLRLYGNAAKTSGQVIIDDVDVLTLPDVSMRKLRGRTIAFVPQDASGSLDPLRRVGSQVVEVLRLHGIETTKAAAWRRAEECLAMVGISDPKRVARSYPHELSGGMRQRILIAIAVSCSPKLLIADEPTTALDVTIQAQVLELFGKLQQEVGMGLLMVTHDVGVARQISDNVAVMYAGRLVERGPGTKVLDTAAHPYTMGLLGAVPTPEVPRGELAAIAGRPPSASELNDIGCPFAPRCPHAIESCSTDLPAMVEVSPTHIAACPVVTATNSAHRHDLVPKEAL